MLSINEMLQKTYDRSFKNQDVVRTAIGYACSQYLLENPDCYMNEHDKYELPPCYKMPVRIVRPVITKLSDKLYDYSYQSDLQGYVGSVMWALDPRMGASSKDASIIYRLRDDNGHIIDRDHYYVHANFQNKFDSILGRERRENIESKLGVQNQRLDRKPDTTKGEINKLKAKIQDLEQALNKKKTQIKEQDKIIKAQELVIKQTKVMYEQQKAYTDAINNVNLALEQLQ